MFLYLKLRCERVKGYQLKLLLCLGLFLLSFNFYCVFVYGIERDAVSLNNEALEYLDREMVDEALPLLEKAYGMDKENKVIRQNLIIAYNLKAKEYEKRGNYDLCVVEYQKILNNFDKDSLTLKNFVTSLNNIGVTFCEKKEYKESEKYFRLAISLLRENKDKELSQVVSVNYARLLNNLAYRDYLNQERISAISDLKRSLRLDPSNPDTYQLLGEIYYDANNYDYAQTYFEKALKINPTNSNLRGRLDMLLREKRVEEDFFRMSDAEKKFVISFLSNEDKEQVAKLLELLGKAYQKIGGDLEFYPKNQISIKIYTPQQFRYVTEMPDWAIGLYDGKIRLKYDDIKADLVNLKQTIYHEMAHSIISIMIKKTLPMWIQEGFAQYEEPYKKITFEDMKLVVEEYQRNGVEGLGFNSESQVELYDKDYLEKLYVSSKLFIDYLIKTYELRKFRLFLIGNLYEKDWKIAFKSAYGKDFEVVLEEWMKYLKWNLIGK